MSPDADDPWLLALGAAVSDGKPIDWDAAARAAPDAEGRALVDNMRRVAELASVHEQPPSRWRHLDLVEKVGEGAFGAVYRGWDPQLEREVAVKLLSRSRGDVASPIDEARHLAKVRHANVVTVYGADRDGGQAGLWMEYLKGQTLAEIIRASGPMSAREATGVALDLSHALSALHGANLLHRDIKATNVMREVGGRIVLMDFSGAHAAAPGTDARPSFSGTPLFMAPELFEGAPATPASDVYSLGVLLFFLLSGALPVTGANLDDLKGAHASGTRKRLRDLRPDLPDAIVQVVERMTAADPTRRFQTAGELEAALLAASGVQDRPGLAPVSAGARWWPAAIVAVAAVVIAALLWPRPVAPPLPALVHFTVGPPYLSGGWPRLSPQGTLAFGTVVEGRSRFWVRALDSPDGHVLAGTTAAETPFWSPDGRTLAFFADGKLKKIGITGGGDAQDITAAPTPHGGDWYGNWILFATDSGIFRIAPDGTDRTQVTAIDGARSDYQHAWPEFLPDGKRFLYVLRSRQAERTGLYLGSIDGSVNTRVMDAYSRTAYSAGHIFFVRDGTLEAQPFDPVRAVATGQPVPIASHVKAHPRSDAAFDVTPDGVLAYSAESELSTTKLTLYDRRGREVRAITPPEATYRQPRVSPDGKHVVAEKGNPSGKRTDLWLFDLARGGDARLTGGPDNEHNVNPAWSPDGTHIAYSKRRNDQYEIVTRLVEGTTPEEPLASLDGDTMLEDWSRDNKYLSACLRRDGLWIIPLDRRTKPWRVRADPRPEAWQSEFSPDSHWIAYTVEEGGRPEVFVEPVPGNGTRVPISTHGGGEPHWRADGKELFYLGTDGTLQSLDVTTADWQHSTATPLFRVMVGEIGGKLDYSPSPDGQSFVVNVFVADPAVTAIDLIVNWMSKLNRK
jgi:Tol biopolymer transport system component